ncbi:MAG TPA: hypothetical protein VJ742_09695, partial [Nitrososphaera sp.]|nr:hypothetical protein [Nitrososphaera sp.]
MAAFDPTIQVGVQNSGIPPMGSPPNLLTLSAGSYLGHFISSMSIKKDTDARNRGTFFAHEHIAAIQGDIVKEKSRTLLNPDFDTTYNSFVSEKLGSVASKQKYEPQNETERLAYAGVIESYKQREYASSFVESAKAYKENAVGMLNQNLATYMEGYHAANPNELAAIRNDIATALASASSSENGNIPITTPSAAREHHTKLIRQGEMSRIMNSVTPGEMIDLLHNPDASVVSPVYDPKTNTFTNSYAMQRLLPAEKEMMMEYVAKKQDKTLALEASARKI